MDDCGLIEKAGPDGREFVFSGFKRSAVREPQRFGSSVMLQTVVVHLDCRIGTDAITQSNGAVVSDATGGLPGNRFGYRR
jgi:hypothetical protein